MSFTAHALQAALPWSERHSIVWRLVMLHQERPRRLRLEIELEADALLSISGVQAYSIALKRAEEFEQRGNGARLECRRRDNYAQVGGPLIFARRLVRIMRPWRHRPTVGDDIQVVIAYVCAKSLTRLPASALSLSDIEKRSFHCRRAGSLKFFRACKTEQLPNAADGKTRGSPSPEARAAPERRNGRPFPFSSIAGYCHRCARPTIAADGGNPWETRHSPSEL